MKYNKLSIKFDYIYWNYRKMFLTLRVEGNAHVRHIRQPVTDKFLYLYLKALVTDCLSGILLTPLFQYRVFRLIFNHFKLMAMTDNAIGTNAGNIWRLLSTKGSLSVRQIGDYTHYKDSLILLAIGWLSRENKVHISDRDGSIYIELSAIFPENYY